MYHLDFRGNDRGGPVLPGRLLVGPGGAGTSEDALRLAPHVTFLVHGFNVSRPQGQETLARLATMLPSAAGDAVVGVCWPGDSWANFASYPLEGNDADDTAVSLARFIDRVLLAGTPLSFVSHSLGARVVLGTVKKLGSRYPVSQVCTMAAAIDDDSLANPRDYAAIMPRIGRLAVLASHKDRVLRFAYPIGDLIQAFVFFRKDRPGGALGFHGARPSGNRPIPSNVLSVRVPDAPPVDHGDYFPGDVPNAQQRRAAQFADRVLGGVHQPDYPHP